jgi:hypothetical protein
MSRKGAAQRSHRNQPRAGRVAHGFAPQTPFARPRPSPAGPLACLYYSPERPRPDRGNTLSPAIRPSEPRIRVRCARVRLPWRSRRVGGVDSLRRWTITPPYNLGISDPTRMTDRRLAERPMIRVRRRADRASPSSTWSQADDPGSRSKRPRGHCPEHHRLGQVHRDDRTGQDRRPRSRRGGRCHKPINSDRFVNDCHDIPSISRWVGLRRRRAAGVLSDASNVRRWASAGQICRRGNAVHPTRPFRAATATGRIRRRSPKARNSACAHGAERTARPSTRSGMGSTASPLAGTRCHRSE